MGVTKGEFRRSFRQFSQDQADDTGLDNKVRHPFLFLLIHPRAMSEAHTQVGAMYDKQQAVLVAAAKKRGEKVAKGMFQDLLQWFLDNSDKIIAIIQKIIAMFVKK